METTATNTNNKARKQAIKKHKDIKEHNNYNNNKDKQE